MNGQIRELALKSGIAYLSEHTAYLTGNDGLTVLPSVSSLEKFAELIVRDCIEIVKPTDHHNAWADDYLGGVDGLELLHSKVKKIKEHFGIEE